MLQGRGTYSRPLNNKYSRVSSKTSYALCASRERAAMLAAQQYSAWPLQKLKWRSTICSHVFNCYQKVEYDVRSAHRWLLSQLFTCLCRHTAFRAAHCACVWVVWPERSSWDKNNSLFEHIMWAGRCYSLLLLSSLRLFATCICSSTVGTIIQYISTESARSSSE